MSFRRLIGVRAAVVTVFLKNKDEEFFFNDNVLLEECEQQEVVVVGGVVVVISLSLSVSLSEGVLRSTRTRVLFAYV